LALVERIRSGEPIRAAAEAVGVSRSTAYKWLARYEDEGEPGLQDRSSAPRSIPHRTPARVVRRIETMRRRRLTGRAIADQLNLARSTVSAVLRRLGLGRLRALEPRRPAVRYEWPLPGDLIHIDVKKLGRFRRPGHRVQRRGQGCSKGAGYEYVHVCIDDHSRVAYAEIQARDDGPAAEGFLRRAVAWLRRRKVRVRRVMTDNALVYTKSNAWNAALNDLGISRHITTRPYRPQTNGKAERFIKTLLHEWAYGRTYRNSLQRAAAFAPWLKRYNHIRPHGGIGDATPITRIRRKVSTT
jgi:transposase